MLPQKVMCDGCGKVLYDNSDLKPPEEIIKKFGGECPHCGKNLIFDPNKVEIDSQK
jgi:DNA-directed RNA polymerase subunit RPC12/RpoP